MAELAGVGIYLPPHAEGWAAAKEDVELDGDPARDDEAEAKVDFRSVTVEVLGQAVVEGAHACLEHP